MTAIEHATGENIDMGSVTLEADALARVPRALALRHDILPLSSEGNQLTIAVPDARDGETLDRVENNQTIVLGGLLRDIDSQTLSKLPGLADIPIIGKIFQNRQHTRERDEIIFLITPHVIYPNGPVPNRLNGS